MTVFKGAVCKNSTWKRLKNEFKSTTDYEEITVCNLWCLWFVSISSSPSQSKTPLLTGKHKHSSGVPNSQCIQLYEWLTKPTTASVCQATEKTKVKQKQKSSKETIVLYCFYICANTLILFGLECACCYDDLISPLGLIKLSICLKWAAVCFLMRLN